MKFIIVLLCLSILLIGIGCSVLATSSDAPHCTALKRWAGEGNFRTETFTIDDISWSIGWGFGTAEGDNQALCIIVREVPNTYVWGGCFSGQVNNYVPYLESGTYYLDIFSFDPWVVTVYDCERK